MFNKIENRKELYKRFHKVGFSVGCEVGVHDGKNAVSIIENIPGIKLYLVEPYKDHPCSIAKWGKYNKNNLSSHENARKRAHKRLSKFNVEWFEMFSEEAVRKIPDSFLDFVHIDGEHSYDFVMIDTILWTRKVRKGGIVSGHDYDKPGVKKAVTDYLTTHGFEYNYTRESKSPSWYFVRM